MADVLPFRALRYAPNLRLPDLLCPPFDTISPEQQQALHQRSPYNAVRIELALGDGDERYRAASAALRQWRSEGILLRDSDPCFYLYEQGFAHNQQRYARRVLFARLRLEPWGRSVLPHEHTFGGPKEDRLKLLRAIRLNTSPVFLVYRDRRGEIGPLLDQAASRKPDARFNTADGQDHALWIISDGSAVQPLRQAFGPETLYVADGHHRYETALAYRDEVCAAANGWTGEEPENFALAALSWANDAGLLVLPIHRVTASGAPLSEAMERLRPLFQIEQRSSLSELLSRLAATPGPALGLATADDGELYLLAARTGPELDAVLPAECSPQWRALDYSIANYAVLRYGLALSPAEMSDYSRLWFTEDAEEAVASVRDGRARYALIMRPVPVGRILDLADSGERMPQKSTFFYPKVPTGLVFNPLEE